MESATLPTVVSDSDPETVEAAACGGAGAQSVRPRNSVGPDLRQFTDQAGLIDGEEAATK